MVLKHFFLALALGSALPVLYSTAAALLGPLLLFA